MVDSWAGWGQSVCMPTDRLPRLDTAMSVVALPVAVTVTSALRDLSIGDTYVTFIGDDEKVIREQGRSWSSASEPHTAITYVGTGAEYLVPSSRVVIPTGRAAIRISLGEM